MGRRCDLWIWHLLLFHVPSHLYLAFPCLLLRSAYHKFLIFCLLLASLHCDIIIDHILDKSELILIESVIVSFVPDFVTTVGQSTLVVYLFALLHKYAKIVRFTLLWVFGALQVLLGDVGPVAQAALHDTLDKSDLLQGAPVSSQKWEIQMVIDVVIMRGQVHRVLWRRLAQAQTLQAHHKFALRQVGLSWCGGRGDL